MGIVTLYRRSCRRRLGDTPVVPWSSTTIDVGLAFFIGHLEAAGRLANPWLGGCLTGSLEERDCRRGHCESFDKAASGPR